MSDRPPIVVYHADCADGFCCAWLFRHAFPDAEFVPAKYGDPPPGATGRRVYVADFSYKRPVLEEMCRSCESLVLLDHHRTAEADLAGFEADNADVFFDMSKSGGRLTWEYLYSRGLLPADLRPASHRLSDSPWLVDYTEDRDLWRWALPNSKEINAALASYPHTFDVWDLLHAADRRDLLAAEGLAITRYQGQQIATHVRNARPVVIAGHDVLCVNATTLVSEIADELAVGRPFGACYFDTGDRRTWSLRSRDGGIDVSEVARRFGGGGHRNAAGFTAAVSWWPQPRAEAAPCPVG